eukprot:scaffold133266_cov94-Phaeocystis_antarctica.AAC.5
MEKAVQISATDVNSETAHFRILCRSKEITKHADHIPKSLWARKISEIYGLLTASPSRSASRGHPEARQPALVQLAAATASCLQNEAATQSPRSSHRWRRQLAAPCPPPVVAGRGHQGGHRLWRCAPCSAAARQPKAPSCSRYPDKSTGTPSHRDT